jgi:hypothetical protein
VPLPGAIAPLLASLKLVAAVPELLLVLSFPSFFASGDHPQEECAKFGNRSKTKVDFFKKDSCPVLATK